jgi:outer membrane protein OmpA-like peptidoglycan-associated protein
LCRLSIRYRYKLARERFRLKLLHWVLIGCWPALLSAQNLEPDAAGCSDSRIVPKLLGCRIDNCEHKDADQREVTLREDKNGDPVTSIVEGESRSVMYECGEGTTPSDIVSQAAAALKAAQFQIPYQFSDREGAITSQKGDLWVLVDAASRYYTLVELKARPADGGAIDAADIADAIERNGRAPIYRVVFTAGSADITPESSSTLDEIAAMLEDNADWRIRVEGHTDSPSLSQRRSTAVVEWLVLHHIKRERLESTGLGDAQPAPGKNQRIDLVRIDPAPR